jgi:hypothetical protein
MNAVLKFRMMIVTIIQPGFNKYRVPLFSCLTDSFDLKIHSLGHISDEHKTALS